MKAAKVILMICAPLALARVVTLPEFISMIDVLAADRGHVQDPLELPHIAVGRRIPVPLGPIGTDNRPILLALCGACASCMVSMIDPATIDAARYSRVVLIFATALGEIPVSYRHLGTEVQVIADPDGRVLNAMGVPPNPRFLLLSPDLRVLDAQKRIDQIPSFVRRKGV